MSSNIPEDFTASVSNWKGTRTIHSSTNEILSEANSISIGVIANVDAALDAMESSGTSALGKALEAVTALGQFTPSAISVKYSPPGMTSTTPLAPGPLNIDIPTGGVAPDIDPITVSINVPPGPTITVDPPKLEAVTFGAAPQPVTFYQPRDPTVDDVKQQGPMPVMTFTEFDVTMPVQPVLRELVLPTFDPQPFPDYVDPGSQPLPDIPDTPHISMDGLLGYVRLWSDEIIKAAPKLGGVLVRDLVTQRDLRNSVETYRIRGCRLDDDLEQAQIDYADEITRLMNQAESRQLIIDEGLTRAEAERQSLRFAVQYQVMMLELAIAVAKVYFEAATAQAEAMASLAKALTAYYNALVAEYNADAQVYKTHIDEEVARLHYWQAQVQAEEAKTKANAQMASLYVQTEQVEGIEAEVYAAQVSTVLAQVERYKAEIEAIAAKAEVAKTSVTVYRGEVDAYGARVAAYKAGFATYAAHTKSVAAQNSAQQQTSEMSLAGASAVAAQAQFISSDIEVTAELLKSQAAKIASSYESIKLTNAVEANKAQIAASVGRVKSLIYSADQQKKEVKNEASAAFAEQAVRYYSSASDSAYRASEQTLKAVTAASQAAALAQESAGRSSAALSQGAMSAVHISAALRGSGSVAGSEAHTANLNQGIQDSLTYSESKRETISA